MKTTKEQGIEGREPLDLFQPVPTPGAARISFDQPEPGSGEDLPRRHSADHGDHPTDRQIAARARDHLYT
ncbi:MAG TPA: hypothetical protein VF378_08190 [Geothrix sp.]